MKYSALSQQQRFGFDSYDVEFNWYANTGKSLSNRTQHSVCSFTKPLISEPVVIHKHQLLIQYLKTIQTDAKPKRWITIIEPPASFNALLLAHSGIDKLRIRIARKHPRHNKTTMLSKALDTNTSDAIIVFGKLEEADRGKITEACSRTDTRVFVLEGLNSSLLH
ncbi:hypothetical protein [Veronia pacifica]|uniref:Uncharacterized protein n=1 Tax=Veronia pacifica TaxID=1080227 RepID=A0A1C3EE22_9GAMM|nr:hypothetical protein [Veronia pacifica]ODA31473.1 hypothetical protein A8L45_16955 [Veronia pacifica]